MAIEDKDPVTVDRPAKTSTWIKVFVLLHVVAITSWALPSSNPDYTNGKKKLELDKTGLMPALRSAGAVLSDGILVENDRYLKYSLLVRPYVQITGFWQYWDMFSPNPSSRDLYCTVKVKYQDGSESDYYYPRIYDYPIQTKYFKERYRKFFERVNADSNSYIWPYFAQFVANQSYTDEKNPPVEVKLTRHWQDVAAPGKPQPRGYNEYTFFTYVVDQSKLQRQKDGG